MQLKKYENVPVMMKSHVSISCDGTWQKRGFTSLNGDVIIMSTDTGKVLDVEVMSVTVTIVLCMES